jgi:CubicO group peptidase (beta-lactamase class C family)
MRKFLLVFLVCICFSPAIILSQTAPDASKGSTGYGKASYNNLNTSKFLKTWLLAGPLKITRDSASPDVGTQKKFFDETHVPAAASIPALKDDAGKELKWKNYSSTTDQVIFDSIYPNTDYASAFAVAEINSDRAMPALLAVGSDDGIKVYHNGKLLHSNWINRQLNPDDDILPVDLVKGSNQILIEVQDAAGDWGFMARFLDKAGVTDRLIRAASSGDIEQIRMLVKRGGDVNLKGRRGINAMQAAVINGRREVEKELISLGGKDSIIEKPEKLIEGLYSGLRQKPNPGIAILVSKDGKILYENGFGYADIQHKAPITPVTTFRIGSITKQFTASAILKLQEEGKLNVSDSLSKYFPDFPRAKEVTIHHLLTHTSGIHSYTNTDSFLTKVLKPVSNEELLNYFKNYPYDFNPGEQYQYNNSGYFLLGYIIEKVSGKSLGQYFKENLFDPAGMKNTGIYKSDLHLEHEAKGYNKTEKGYEPALNWDMSWAGGAGAMYSTVEDLNKWNDALFNGKVLSEKSFKAAFTPVLLNNGSKPPGVDYGYGWSISNYRGLEMLGHSGGLHGFISQLARYTPDNLTVVMLTNQLPVEVELDPNKIAEIFLWQKMDTQSSYLVKESGNQDLKVYKGIYELQPGVVIVITNEGKSLYAQVSGQSKFEIFPSSPDEFFWKVVEAKIHFNKNVNGEVVDANFVQGTYKAIAPKLKEEKTISLDTAIYREYVGKFDLGQNIIVDITSSGGKIYAQATGQQRYEMLPISKEEFIIRDLNAKVLFVKDAGGKVDKITVNMAGRKNDALKINK